MNKITMINKDTGEKKELTPEQLSQFMSYMAAQIKAQEEMIDDKFTQIIFQQKKEISALREKLNKCKIALSGIKDQDYRGNRCACMGMAFKEFNEIFGGEE